MKHIAMIVTVALTATTFGCKDASSPKTETRVESASEAARSDDRAIAERLAQQKASIDAEYEKGRARESRQRYVDILRDVSKRWESGLNEARRTPRSDIAAQITKLQVILKDSNTVDVDDCSSGARASLQTSMATSIEAFGMFQKETGESGDATTQKVTQAAEQLRKALAEIEACLNK